MVLWYGSLSSIRHNSASSSRVLFNGGTQLSPGQEGRRYTVFLISIVIPHCIFTRCNWQRQCFPMRLVHMVTCCVMCIASNSTCYPHQPAHSSVIGNIPIATKPRALSVSWRSAYATALRPSVCPSACLSTGLSICTTKF